MVTGEKIYQESIKHQWGGLTLQAVIFEFSRRFSKFQTRNTSAALVELEKKWTETNQL